MTRAEEAALKAYPISTPPSYIDGHDLLRQEAFIKGFEQAEKDIIALIESRLSELLGDAQPTPILRYELRDLINKIKEDEK